MGNAEASTVGVENSLKPVHGRALCWAARIACTGLNLFAAAYLLSHWATYDQGLWSILSAICLFVLSVVPALIAWRSHLVGGVFALIISFLYTEVAYSQVDRNIFVHTIFPFSAVWLASGILHLAVWWRERSKRIPLRTEPSHPTIPL